MSVQGSQGQSPDGATHAESPAPAHTPALPLIWRIANAPFIAVIYLYRFTLSPIIGGQCRFTPTCSHYGLECYRAFNTFRATRLTLWRILRCNPFGGHGFDPPPPG